MTATLNSTSSRTVVNRVLVCDEREAARTALTSIVAQAIPTVRDVDSSTNATDLIAQYARMPADLVLIALRKGRPGGAAAIDQLFTAYPDAPVIVFGSVDDTADIAAAIARGARGFLSWDANNTAASPARQRPANISRLSPAYPKMAAGLTERELQILRGMTRGLSNGEIGRKLFLSEDTVKTHARRLFQKLGAYDRAHAVGLGLRNGLVA